MADPVPQPTPHRRRYILALLWLWIFIAINLNLEKIEMFPYFQLVGEEGDCRAPYQISISLLLLCADALNILNLRQLISQFTAIITHRHD